jgi:pimeloyl-ACP methyl ester carboxylesterase
VRQWTGDAGAVVFWPGLNADGPTELDEVAPLWAEEHGLQVLAVSPPGLGETPPLDVEGFRPSALTSLVVRVLDALSIERAVFAGFSWGGFVGCRLAALAPERLSALVLLEGGHADLGPEASLEEWIEVARGIRPALPDPEAAGAAIWGIVREPPSETWPSLARLEAPVLLVTGGDRAESFSQSVPLAEIQTVPNAGHELLRDSMTGNLVGTWLAQQKTLR